MMEYRSLAGRIREYLTDVDRVVERAIRFAAEANQTGDEAYWDAVALNLHSYYSGVERILEDVARTIDGSIPEGPDWHQRLLFQMSAEIPEIRPAVIDRETRIDLDEFRAFRHVVRNVYAFNLRPSRLQELVQDLSGSFGAVQKDLLGFIRFLEELDDPGSG
ncbi:MAG: hypothetical protein VB089_01120 [Anaerolineaceae bacterium]|nr:hypothetical protein [Anaerolineaceae bacterium]